MTRLYDSPDLLRDLKRMRIDAERRIVSEAGDYEHVGWVVRKAAAQWMLWEAGVPTTHYLTALEAVDYVRFFVEHGTFPHERVERVERVRAPRSSNRKSEKLRDMDAPAVLGYALDRSTLVPVRETIDVAKSGDYGADPIGDGTFRMVPSGDIVDFTERNRRLSRKGGR